MILSTLTFFFLSMGLKKCVQEPLFSIFYTSCLISNVIYPGSDLAGETSAALSAVSIVFAKIDSNFSASCLSHAKQLYMFATQYRGLYHDAIKGAAQYYE